MNTNKPHLELGTKSIHTFRRPSPIQSQAMNKQRELIAAVTRKAIRQATAILNPVLAKSLSEMKDQP